MLTAPHPISHCRALGLFNEQIHPCPSKYWFGITLSSLKVRETNWYCFHGHQITLSHLAFQGPAQRLLGLLSILTWHHIIYAQPLNYSDVAPLYFTSGAIETLSSLLRIKQEAKELRSDHRQPGSRVLGLQLLTELPLSSGGGVDENTSLYLQKSSGPRPPSP